MGLALVSGSLESVVSGIVSEINEAGEVALEITADAMAERVRESFADENRSRGEAWERTSEIALRMRRNPPPPGSNDWLTLVDTGALRDSVQVQQVTRTAHGFEAIIGTDLDYGAEMQLGTVLVDESGTEHVVPARPFQFWNDDDVAAVADLLEEALHG